MSEKSSLDGAAKGQPVRMILLRCRVVQYFLFCVFFVTKQNISLVPEQGKLLEAERNLEEVLW